MWNSATTAKSSQILMGRGDRLAAKTLSCQQHYGIMTYGTLGRIAIYFHYLYSAFHASWESGVASTNSRHVLYKLYCIWDANVFIIPRNTKIMSMWIMILKNSSDFWRWVQAKFRMKLDLHYQLGRHFSRHPKLLIPGRSISGLKLHICTTKNAAAPISPKKDWSSVYT